MSQSIAASGESRADAPGRYRRIHLLPLAGVAYIAYRCSSIGYVNLDGRQLGVVILRGIVSDIAFWGGGWILVSTVLGVLLGKCIAVGMGTHPRAPAAEESTIAEAPLPEPSGRLLAEIAALTGALEKRGEAPARTRSERRKAS